MRKKITQWSLLGSVVFVLLSFNVDTLLVRFLLIGELPGSTHALSPMTMLCIYTAGFAVTLAYIVLPRSQMRELNKRAQSMKSRLPSKRFSAL
jgi:hypothetical protein